jgi:pimeloyl-ACP methyl ester carboxylesterase
VRSVEFGGIPGDLHEAGPSCVVLAHGFTGDRSMGGRFDRFCAALVRAKISALAIDLPSPVLLPRHVEAVLSALAFLRASGFSRLALFGHSWGSLVCTHAAPELPMVLSGALLGPIRYRWDEFYPAAQLERSPGSRLRYSSLDSSSASSSCLCSQRA